MKKKRCRGDEEKIDTSNKFGSFIILAASDKFEKIDWLPKRSSEHALIMLSSSSESESDQSLSESSDCWWTTEGSNDQEDDDNDSAAAAAKSQVVVFKVDNNLEDQPQQQQQQQQLVFKLNSLGFPKHLNDEIIIVGSSNGLVCLYEKDHNNKIFLWNPAIRQFRSLPDSMTIRGEWCDCSRDQRLVSFGFDVKTNDYKVVLLTGFRSKYFRFTSISRAPMECLCQVQVYSLRTDSWRLFKGGGDHGDGVISLPGYPFFQDYRTEVLYLNGSCFFPAQFFHSKHERCIPENNRFIISLDLTKEIITPIQLPYHHQNHQLYLFSYLSDKIVLFKADIKLDHDDQGDGTGTEICSDVFDIWVLNEYGGGGDRSNNNNNNNNNVNMKSWKMLHSFEIEREGLHQGNLPRGISNDGDFALLETIDPCNLFATVKKMKLYSLGTKKVKGNFLSCSRVISNAYPYKPNQVSIIGENESR